MIEIKPSKYKFNKNVFNNFQKNIGVNLPKDYVIFLEKNNGGTPEGNIVELQNEEIRSFSVTEFFGFNNERINDLKSQYEIYKERIPAGNIPICRVDGGNIICLNTGNGSISLWDHDTELLINDPNNSLVYVAGSFKEFFKMMKPSKQEDHFDDYKIEDVWVSPDLLSELKNNND